MLETQARPLTKDDIKALRNCDRVSFYFIRNIQNKKTLYHSYISATFVHKIKGINGELEKTEYIDIPAFDRIHTYNGINSESVKACFCMNHFGQGSQWQAIAAFLRVGDMLEIEWLVDNASGYISKSVYTDESRYVSNQQLHKDDCKLTVIRGQASKKKRYTFLIESAVCPNNTARMVKVENW